MKKVLFLVVALLVMVGWTMAQTSGGNAGSSSAPSAQQNQTAPDQSGQAGQAGQAGQTSPDQSATQNQPATGNQAAQPTGKKGKLPQTGSPLPLLGLLGAGSLGAGLVSRRRKH